MAKREKTGRYAKFLLYAVLVVLANTAGITLFKRFDLTAGDVFSLSAASRRAVAELAEPLTINVFFTRDLPAPHNNTERYLRDLLAEYAAVSNRFFNYRFYDVSAEQGELGPEARRNQKLANDYGIHPLQIQVIENDEVKFQRAYMGLVLIHGDLIERIPAITTTDGLEYRLTTAINKMTHKISALMRLEDKIKARLYLSKSLEAVGPFMNIQTLPQLPQQIARLVAEAGARNYDVLEFEHVDPPDGDSAQKAAARYNLLMLSWPALNQGAVPAGKGAIGLVLERGERWVTVPLLQVLRLPLIGTQYKLTETEKISRAIDEAVESLIDINAELGYLADFGTLPLEAPPPGMPGARPQQEALNNFKALASQNYTLRRVRLAEEDLPEGLRSLVIAGPQEPLSDWALFQIDQFLMRGGSLALFLDRFAEAAGPGQAAQFQPLDTGLEKLLAHYGVRVKTAYVMDESCFKQELPQRMGGGERPIYFAPLIKDQNISKDFGFLKNIRTLITLKASPLELDGERIKAQGLTAHQLVASSERSWEMRGRIDLNPLFIRPPAEKEQFGSRPLAYLLEGEFESYFAGKPLPVREAPQKAGEQKPQAQQAAEGAGDGKPAADELSKIERSGQFVARGRPGRIFVMASAEMLKDSLLDEEGRGTNAMFALNVIDYLNGNEDIAVMRGKVQRFNPLRETPAATKTFVKAFNIVGLPVITALFGLAVWARRAARKRRIQMLMES